ncbi:MAG: NB-ARC domain-containing protein, partial [Brasilonema sp.]
MKLEAALVLVDTLIFSPTGKHLSDLQSTILQQVWQGKKYLDIAENYSCTEGHVKDVAYLLWKFLSETLEERVTKGNFRTVLERRLRSESEVTNISNYIIESPHFMGRENALNHLNNLVYQGSKIIVIQGEGGIGKITLAQHYLNGLNFELVLELLMAKETQNITSVATVIEEWLKKDFNEEPGREFGVTLGRLKRHLETRKIGILIDNLETALDKDGKLIKPHRHYGELLRVLADTRVQSVTLITSRDRLCESDINMTLYRIPGLEEKTWKKFFNFHQIHTDDTILKMIYKTYGGNAKAMGIICGVIQEDFENDINAYWQENQDNPLAEIDLKNLVASQFDRLKILDIDAYQLLCRLGCYRYQDVPTISKSGLLCLLWDLETSKQKYIVESLRNRSLIEFHKGNYWLHPLIRAEAIARLRGSEDWKIVNCKAANYWTESVEKIETIQNDLIALEAYYHYIKIKDLEQASQVILKSRNNQW